MTDALALFVVASFATYRIWRFLAKDTILERPRESIYNHWPPNHQRARMVRKWNVELHEMVGSTRKGTAPPVSMFSLGLDCPWCSGFWISGAVTLVLVLTTSVPLPLLWWPAMSSVVGLFGRLDSGENA